MPAPSTLPWDQAQEPAPAGRPARREQVCAIDGPSAAQPAPAGE